MYPLNEGAPLRSSAPLTSQHRHPHTHQCPSRRTHTPYDQQWRVRCLCMTGSGWAGDHLQTSMACPQCPAMPRSNFGSLPLKALHSISDLPTHSCRDRAHLGMEIPRWSAAPPPRQDPCPFMHPWLTEGPQAHKRFARGGGTACSRDLSVRTMRLLGTGWCSDGRRQLGSCR